MRTPLALPRGAHLIPWPGYEGEAAPVIKGFVNYDKSCRKAFDEANIAMLQFLINLNWNTVFHMIFKVKVRR